jgi:hypothetical protein
MKKISFEMAKELGLIPQPTKRYFGWFPFMSAYGVEKRDKELEVGYKAELDRIKMDYQFVYFRGEKLRVV